MAYQKLTENITEAVNYKFGRIAARHNFDLGVEFEIGICELLAEILPVKYGVCRGFAVTASGDSAGDDILVYDQERFPKIRFLKSNDYSKKQEIPIEAVYAYIEAKHTIFMDDPSNKQA